MTGRQRRNGLLAGALIGLAVFGPGTYAWVKLSLEQRRLDGQLARLTVEHAQLTQEQERLQSDSTYVEGLIRTTFKLAKPGEIVIPLDSSSSQR